MKILQIGVPKSGNFWLYQIIQQILKFSGNHQKSFIRQHPIHILAKDWDLNFPEQANIDVIDITDLQVTYRISSIFKMPIEDFSSYASKTPHVWTHSPVCKKTGDIFSYFDKKICIIRDPRDVVLSAARYYCSDYMLKYFPQPETRPEAFLQKNFEKLMHEWVWHVWDHLRLQEKHRLHLCYFEGFLKDFQKELSLLLDYLKIDLSTEQRKNLEEAVSFQSLKKENPKHVKKGTSRQWTERLSASQKQKARQIAGPLLDYLGYNQENPSEFFPRKTSSEDMLELKKKLIKSNE